MTKKEQDEFWLKFHRFQMRYELMYHPIINKALKAQVQQYVTTGNLMNVNSAGLYLVLMDLYKTTGAVWAYKTRMFMRDAVAAGKLKHRRFNYRGKIHDVDSKIKAMGQMGFSERIVSFMQQYFSIDLLNDAENITRTTIRLIQEVLSDAALEGWSFDEIVKKLVTPDFTAKRARLIARTETVGAANAGSLLNANSTGLELNKIWIASRDNRTRPHHREVNQTVIPKDAKFQVGTSLMDYPGDKAGGASEVCNCRCAIAFIPV